MTKVLFDLDGTVYDLLAGVEKEFPEFKAGELKKYTFEDGETYKARDIYDLFDDPIFFYMLEPYQNAKKAIDLMTSKYQIEFYTSCNNDHVFAAKKQALIRDFPLFGANVVLHRYEEMDSNHFDDFDVIVDDNVMRLMRIKRVSKNDNFVVSIHEYNSGEVPLLGCPIVNPFSPSYAVDLYRIIERLNTIGKY